MRARLRNALVIAQVAIALVLLVGAGLLVRSLWNLQAVQTGIATVGAAHRCASGCRSRTSRRAGPYFEHAKRVALIRGVLERLAASAEVEHAGMATALPATRDSGSAAFAVEGWTPDRERPGDGHARLRHAGLLSGAGHAARCRAGCSRSRTTTARRARR